MEEGTFSDATVAEYIKNNFVPAKIKTTNNETYNTPFGEMQTGQLVRALQLRGVPAVYFFDADGKPVFNVPGYVPAEMYHTILRYVAEEHYKNKSFEDFQALEGKES